MKKNVKTVRIQNIQQAAGKNGLPGNIIINKKLDEAGKVLADCWYNSRELRNVMLGAGLNPLIPVIMLTGATLSCEVLTIEAEDLANGPYSVKFPGKDSAGKDREVTYKQAGTHNTNLSINFDSLPVEKYVALMELSVKFNRRNQAIGGAAPVAAPAEELTETIAPPADTTAPPADETVEHVNLED